LLVLRGPLGASSSITLSKTKRPCTLVKPFGDGFFPAISHIFPEFSEVFGGGLLLSDCSRVGAALLLAIEMGQWWPNGNSPAVGIYAFGQYEFQLILGGGGDSARYHGCWLDFARRLTFESRRRDRRNRRAMD